MYAVGAQYMLLNGEGGCQEPVGMGQSESRVGAQRCWPHGLSGCSGTKDGTEGWGGSPTLWDGSHELPLQKRGVQSPPCMQGPCGVPRARAICPETEEGFVLTPRASPLLTVPSPPAHRVPDTEVCTEKAADPSGSQMLASGAGKNFI